MRRTQAGHEQRNRKWRTVRANFVEIWGLLRDEWKDMYVDEEVAYIAIHDLSTEYDLVLSRAKQQELDKQTELEKRNDVLIRASHLI